MNHSLSHGVNVSSFAPEGGFRSPEGAALGNNTKSSPPPIDETRLKRYKLLHTAQYLTRSESVNCGMQVFDLHRVSKCSHCRIRDFVTLNQNSESKKAFYSDVAVCGSVWACPVCAAKIQEKRRKEIAAVMSAAYSAGYVCHMITLTFPHKSFQKCGDLLDSQAEALKYLRKGGAFTDKYLKQKLGYYGVVRSLEVVHGRNGWHPHTHELWVCRSDADFSDLRSRVTEKWIASLIKAGLLDADNARAVASVRLHGVDVYLNADSSDYLAKHDDSSYLQARGQERSGQWGADHEIAKSSSKSKSIGRHPFQILADFDHKTNRRDASLYLEYLEAFTSRRKRQLYIAPKLRALALVDEISDSEIAESEPVDFEYMGRFNALDWGIITDSRKQAYILDLAENSGFSAVESWLLQRGGGFKYLVSDYRSRATLLVSD